MNSDEGTLIVLSENLLYLTQSLNHFYKDKWQIPNLQISDFPLILFEVNEYGVLVKREFKSWAIVKKAWGESISCHFGMIY